MMIHCQIGCAYWLVGGLSHIGCDTSRVMCLSRKEGCSLLLVYVTGFIIRDHTDMRYPSRDWTAYSIWSPARRKRVFALVQKERCSWLD